MTEQRERPIIFSAESVRAIIEGRKTQTRRVLASQPPSSDFEGPYWFTPAVVDRNGELQPAERDVFGISDYDGEWGRSCRYGAPGERLWVREAFRLRADHDHLPARDYVGRPWYAADPDSAPSGCAGGSGRLRSGRFMPRWASRLTLEITGVRVERVQDISEADARAEGVVWVERETAPGSGDFRPCARDEFRNGWDALNAKRGFGWDANPFVWVIEFRRVEP